MKSKDSTGEIQALLDRGGNVEIPPGFYRITGTLRIRSGTTLRAAPNARFCLCGDTPRRRGDFLLTNSDHGRGSRDITIDGGIWDGNNSDPNNKKGELFDPEGFSGTALNFFNVENLTLRNMIVANSTAYNIRAARIDGFVFDNIAFLGDRLNPNQDGLHFNGSVRNGRVSNIYALSKGQTNDDLIALNADDSMLRVENLGSECGGIENIIFKNIYAEDCHTLVRMLSVDSAIRNIRFENLKAGCRCYAVNCDAARYCRTPLFREDDRPDGVGIIENVVFEGMTVHMTADRGNSPMILLECNAENLRFNGFERPREKDVSPNSPAFTARNVAGMRVKADGMESIARDKGDVISVDCFGEMCVRREGKRT